MALQEKRKEKGWSQSQLAEIAGVNVRTLQFYEQGVKDVNGAKLNTLLSLAIALDCSIYDIVTNEELKGKIEIYRNVIGSF